MGALVDYLDLTQRGNLPLLRQPAARIAWRCDADRRGDPPQSGNYRALCRAAAKGLFLRRSTTPPPPRGARLLERDFPAPSRDLSQIAARHQSVRFLLDQSRYREDLRSALRRVPDMDRALSRIALDRGGPRDLAAIRAGLTQAEAIAKTAAAKLPPLLADSDAGPVRA